MATAQASKQHGCCRMQQKQLQQKQKCFNVISTLHVFCPTIQLKITEICTVAGHVAQPITGCNPPNLQAQLKWIEWRIDVTDEHFIGWSGYCDLLGALLSVCGHVVNYVYSLSSRHLFVQSAALQGCMHPWRKPCARDTFRQEQNNQKASFI